MDVYNFVGKLMQEAISKLKDRVINIGEQTVVDALETCDVDHNKTFIKAALRNALNRQLVSILDDFLRTRESFENALIQAATAPESLAIGALAIA